MLPKLELYEKYEIYKAVLSILLFMNFNCFKKGWCKIKISFGMVKIRNQFYVESFQKKITRIGNEFTLFFSKPGCLSKAKEPNQSYYLPTAREDKRWIYVFPKGISLCANASQPHTGFELQSLILFLMMITVMLSMGSTQLLFHLLDVTHGQFLNGVESA